MAYFEDKLIEFFAGRGDFANFGIEVVRTEFDWRLPTKIAQKYGTDITGSRYQATIDLKQKFTKEWQRLEAEAEPLDHFVSLAKDILKWGGINRYLEKNINQYCEETLNPPMRDFPINGIASRSKILSIAKPDQYAIMDARVVATINTISLMVCPTRGAPFPYLPSRNSNLKHLKRTNSHAAGGAYSRYLSLLQAVSGRLDKEGIRHTFTELEMALFQAAPCIVQRWNRSES